MSRFTQAADTGLYQQIVINTGSGTCPVCGHGAAIPAPAPAPAPPPSPPPPPHPAQRDNESYTPHTPDCGLGLESSSSSSIRSPSLRLHTDEEAHSNGNLRDIIEQIIANARTYYQPTSFDKLDVVTTKETLSRASVRYHAMLMLRTYSREGVLTKETVKMSSFHLAGRTRLCAVINLLDELEQLMHP